MNGRSTPPRRFTAVVALLIAASVVAFRSGRGPVASAGLGVRLSSGGGTTGDLRGGRCEGGTATFGMDRDSRVVVAILSNRTDAPLRPGQAIQPLFDRR